MPRGAGSSTGAFAQSRQIPSAQRTHNSLMKKQLSPRALLGYGPDFEPFSATFLKGLRGLSSKRSSRYT